MIVKSLDNRFSFSLWAAVFISRVAAIFISSVANILGMYFKNVLSKGA